MKKLTKQMVSFQIEPLDEYTPIEMALSEKETGTDAHADYIQKVLDDEGANIWLWCSVKVTAKFGTLEGSAYLGQCAYQDETDFIKGGYYEQMQDEAFEDLESQLADLIQPLQNRSIWSRLLSFLQNRGQQLAVSFALWLFPSAVLLREIVLKAHTLKLI